MSGPVHCELVVVGTSSGGLAALSRLLGRMPKRFAVPIVVVQHRSKESSDDAMENVVQGATELVVQEAEDKEPLLPGHVYLAPADYHLLVDGGHLALSLDDLVAYSRPSIDVMFETAADSFGPAVIGVLLTGANQDGTRGLERIKAAGGLAIVQDPTTAESPTMPRSAMLQVRVDRVLSIDAIADALCELTHGATERLVAKDTPALRV